MLDDTAITTLPAQPVYSEKASRAEMEVGGYYLNVAGIIFLVIGLVFFLKMKVLGLFSAGVLQVLAGAAAGAGLIVLGDRAFRTNMQKYGHPLIAGGFSILFITVCAAYFHYHLLAQGLFFVFITALVAGSGISVFRYDSKLIGNLTLGALFLAPSFLGARLPLETLVTYLAAINVGTAYVAYYKKWDYYLLVAFLGTYVLYFSHFQMLYPAPTLAFLIGIYLLHLVSNNVLHFIRKSTSGYNLLLSFVNPLVFAATSYFVLLKMMNATATLVYLAIAVIHLALARKAAKLQERDGAFCDITATNLTLGILFVTAAISFITYFSQTTSYFAVVTALWFLEAFVLLEGSFRPEATLGLDRILRRSSCFCMLLAGAQLFLVIPTMADALLPGTIDEKLVITVVSILLCFLYFLTLYRRRDLLGGEERAAMVGSALASFALVLNLGIDRLPILHALVALCLVSYLFIAASVKFNDVLGGFRYAGVAGFTISFIALVFYPHETLPFLFNGRCAVYLAAASIFMLATGALDRSWFLLPDRDRNIPAVFTGFTVLILVKLALLEAVHSGSTFLVALVALGFLRNRSRESNAGIAQLLLFLVFIKSIVFDANLDIRNGNLDIAMWGAMGVGDFLTLGGTVWAFFAAAALVRDQVAHRNVYTLLGLITLAFHVTHVLYNYLGILDIFQVILSVFWCCCALLIITYGVVKEVKVSRLFGLVILIASVLKICLVDIWVLNAYNQMTTLLIMGGLLIATSFIYQSHREALAEAPVIIVAFDEDGERPELPAMTPEPAR